MAKKGEYLRERLPEDRKAYVHLVSGEKVDTQDLITLSEAGKIADVSRAAVQKWIVGEGLGGRGKLKTVLIGKTPYTCRKWLKDVTDKRETPDRVAELERQNQELQAELRKVLEGEAMRISEGKPARTAEELSEELNQPDELEKKIEEQLGL